MKFVFDRRGNEERFSILINFIEDRVQCVQYKKTSSFSMSFTYLSFPALIQTEWGPYYQQCCKLICRAANIVDSEDDRRSPE